jgi:hypothetical protein
MPEAKNASADSWHRLANRLLLDYVRERLGKNPTAWGRYAPYQVTPNSSPQSESTRLVVAAKNAWADGMAALEEMPASEIIRDQWRATIQRAEAEISHYLART